MKIKNLKYIFGFILYIFFCDYCIVYGSGCRSNLQGGTDTGHLTACFAPASPPYIDYNNSIQLSEFSPNAQLFLKMIGETRVPCTNGNYSSSETLVRGIQTKMQTIGEGCSTCIDGKIGPNTSNAMSACPNLACAGYMTPRLENGNLVCDDNYKTGSVGRAGAICCEEIEEPEVTISSPNFDPSTNNDFSESLSIYVSFDIEGTGLTQNNLNCDNGKFSIVGGSLNQVTPDSIGEGETAAGCSLDIYVNSNEVTVTVNPGVIQIGDNQSSAGSNTYNRDEPENTCETPPGGPNNDNCNTYGSNWAFDFDTNCCVEGDSCLVEPDLGGSCPDGYNPDGNGCCIEAIICDPPLALPNPLDNPPSCPYGYSLQNGCCACELFAGDNGCGDGYSPNSQGCCRPASQMCGEKEYMPSGSTGCKPCDEGTLPNEDHTKCICDSSKACCGIKLNTVVPFIGDCIELDSDSTRSDTTSVNSVTAFPILMQGLMKIVMSVIMVFSFIMLIVAGLLMTAGSISNNSFSKGKTILKNVIISLILLGCSGLILSLINPSFFGG